MFKNILAKQNQNSKKLKFALVVGLVFIALIFFIVDCKETSANSEYAGNTLIFNLEQGWGNGIIIHQDFVALQRMVESMQMFQNQGFDVYALINPIIADKDKLDNVLDILSENEIPFVFKAYDSDSMILGTMMPSINVPYDVSHGISLSIAQIENYRQKYGSMFAGLHIFEVFAMDFTVRACKGPNPEWCADWSQSIPSDDFFQKELAEQFVEFAKNNNMFVFWSDPFWFTFNNWGDEFSEAQKDNEEELKDILTNYPDVVVVAYANNEANEQSRNLRFDTWQQSVEPFVQYGAKGFGLSDQSWLCYDEISCSAQEIADWAISAFGRGGVVVEFEPSWYLWNLPKGAMSEAPDYTDDPAWEDRGFPTSNLVYIANALGVTINGISGQPCSAGSDCCLGVCNVNCCVAGECPADDWYDTGDSYFCCNGNSKCVCQDKEYRNYSCDTQGECIDSVAETKTTKSNCESCDDLDGWYNGVDRDYYCSAGECKFVKDLDVVAPATINDLSVDSIAQTSVELQWTSTGDDNNQYAANEYDIRYSAKGELEDFDWDSAIVLSGEPVPLTAGSAQSYVVVGLSPGATYYFAIKSADEVSNWSEISNVVSATTLFPEDKIKPNIIITRPVSEVAYYTTENLITLRGTASDNVEVRQVSWTNSLGGSGIASGSDIWTIASVSLQQGINAITVIAKDSSGNTNTDVLNVTFRPESLSVALIVEPSSGVGSLENVDLQTAVTNASGNGVDYTFWCNCNDNCGTIDDCKSVCGNWVYKKTGASNTTYAIKDICGYAEIGNYFAKVIAENDGQFASARAQIIVSEYIPPVADIVAPAKASGFVATAGDSKIVLQWNNPQDSDFTRVLIIRKQGSAPVSRTDGNVVYEGNLETYTDTGLDNDITYYYAIYSYDNVPNYSEPVVAFARLQAMEPEPEPALPTQAPAGAEAGAEPISEMTIAELKAKIAEIMARIKQLQILLAEMQGEPQYQIPSDFIFNNNLILRVKHPDVIYLKIILEQEIQGISWTRSNYFGPKTFGAVKAFQNKYKQDISKIAGYTIRASGFIGPGTRAKLNQILQNYY